MGRCYKLIMAFFISIFMIISATFVYKVEAFNLMNIGYLFKKIESVEYKKIKVDDNFTNKQSLDYEKEISKNSEVLKMQNFKDQFAKNNETVIKNKYEDEETNEDKKEGISLSDDQLYLLSKLVAAEARGESYQGQVAVAAVVLNRVQDSRFPDSIEDVIYQKNAFSVVKNGSINVQPTEESYKAAKDALYGNDPTNDAIYFWNPDISTCNWINTLNPHLRIGNHVFAR